MTRRSNVTVGLLAIAATLVIIPASVTMIRASGKARQTIAVLRAARTFEIRSSNILDPDLYDHESEAADKSGAGLRLVSIVATTQDAQAALSVWNAAREEPVIGQTGMKALLIGVGTEQLLDASPNDVAVSHVRNLEEFSIRTGIRAVPFTLVIADEQVLAASLGLPDVPFIRDAADRFVREGRNAVTKFRRMTAEINSGLTPIEALIPSSYKRGSVKEK